MAGPRPIYLTLDFDGTLTRKDTLSALATCAYDSPAPPSTSWEEIVEGYMADYKTHVHNQLSAEERTTLALETAFLNSSREVERRSVRRIEALEIFRDVGRTELYETAKRRVEGGDVEMRRGWMGLIALVGEINSRFESMRAVQGKRNENGEDKGGKGVDVLSVNFSRWWIWCVLCAAAERDGGSVEGLRGLRVFANEIRGRDLDLQVEGEDQRPGGGVVEVRTSGDKLVVFDDGRRRLECVEPKPLEMYIGDSTGDLECLLAADIGICIRDKEMGSGQRDLAETCARLGIEVSHISAYGDPYKESAGEKKLWFVEDFRPIETWLRLYS